MIERMNHSKTKIALALTAALSLPSLALAADEAEDKAKAKAVKYEVIQVTATKRSESIQEVPLSISAFGSDFIEESGIKDIQDLSAYAPNLTITQTTQVANTRISIRGVGSIGNNGLEPSVAVFLDGVYIPRPGAIIGRLQDIEVVEVLRGPQGTLFGRNASMGALNIRTKKAELDNTTSLWGGFGSDSLYYGGMTVNRELGDDVAGRISVQTSDQGGFAYSTISDVDIGASKDTGVRGSLIFPIGKVNATLRGDWKKIENNGNANSVLSSSVLPKYTGAIAFILDDDLTNGLFDGPVPNMTDTFDLNLNQYHKDDAEDEQWGISLDLDWSSTNYSYRSITSLREWDNSYYESAIRLPGDLLPRTTIYNTITFSQEFQILSEFDGPFQYVAGVYFYDESYDIDQSFDFGSDFCSLAVHNKVWNAVFTGNLAGGAPLEVAQDRAFGTAAVANNMCSAGPQDMAIASEFSQKAQSMAVFAQGTYDFNDQWSATLGIRYSDDEKTGSFVNEVNNQIAGAPSPTNPFGLNLRAEEDTDLSLDDSQVTWLSTIKYNPNDNVMMYASYSTGYKAGGFNSEGAALDLGDKRTFDAEQVDSLEFGVKSNISDFGILNVTLYRTDLENFQDRTFDGISFLVLNAGELRQQGVEFDLDMFLTDNIRATIGGSYLDSEFLDYKNASNLPGFDQGQTQDITGSRNNFSPEYQFSSSLEWRDSIGNEMEWYVRGEYQYVGERNPSGTTDNNPATIQDGYALVNMRLGIGDDLGNWNITLYAKNLTDENYCMGVGYQPLASTLGLVDSVTGNAMTRCYISKPKSFGAEFRYNF